MTSSRSRIVIAPRSSNVPAITRRKTRSLTASVRKSTSGGTPSGMIRCRAVLTAGSPVRGSHTGKPVMALLDLLGRRWALRILWELRNGALTSRALGAACGGVSPTVLHDRTKELRAAGLLQLEEPGGDLPCPLRRHLR